MLVCVREGAACMVHTGPGGRQHAPSASQASSLALIKAQARLCRSQRGRFNHRFTSSFSPIWRPLLPLLLSDTFFCQSAFLKFVSGGKKASRRLLQTPAGGPRSPANNKAPALKTALPQAVLSHTHSPKKKKKIKSDFYFLSH